MNESWKHFERVVAAIHMAKDSGASVTWNEDIDGRQFDVAIRFKFQFYDFLTLIECKNFKRRVPVEKVEAFVTKSRSAKADKAIMVSAKGFQEGCRKVAKDHKIELYTLREVERIPSDLLTGNVLSTLQIRPLAFIKTGSRELITFTNDENKIGYEVANTRLSGDENMTVTELLRPLVLMLLPYTFPGAPKFPETLSKSTELPQLAVLELFDNAKVKFPDSDEEIPVSEFHFLHWLSESFEFKDIGFDPTVFTSLGIEYQYRNELTDEVTTINLNDLELGFDTKLEVGKFYRQPKFKFAYYIENIENDIVTVFLVESYQHGGLLQARLKQHINSSKYYVEITDENEIARLTKMYQKITATESQAP